MKQLLLEAVKLNASDLHITVGLPPMMRINGSLRPVDNTERLIQADTEPLVTGLMSADVLARFDREGDVDFSYGIPGVARFRVNAYRQRTSVGGAFRVIPTEIRSLEELGLPATVGELAAKPSGMVLVTGPAGSGKSTTLASIIDIINGKRACHIITLEDPIEYLHKHRCAMVNQREIGLTKEFRLLPPRTLREIPTLYWLANKDLETTAIALTVETGHLPFATLHTNDSVQPAS